MTVIAGWFSRVDCYYGIPFSYWFSDREETLVR